MLGAMKRLEQTGLPRGIRSVEIRVRGLVQGVGFRPYVWRLANELALVGDVSNDHAGVLIHCAGPFAAIKTFVHRLETNPPKQARIDSIDISHSAPARGAISFEIIGSAPRGEAAALVPDMATCEDCLAEVADPQQRRHTYAFTNCTHCGPRLTILERAPYDRHNTSMHVFTMCDDCRKEYVDPADRRFHAQPIACPRCGPTLGLSRSDGSSTDSPSARIRSGPQRICLPAAASSQSRGSAASISPATPSMPMSWRDCGRASSVSARRSQ